MRIRLLLAASLWAVVCHAEPDARIRLAVGHLFIPQTFQASEDGFDLTLHLHGAVEVVEREFLAAKGPGVLVNVTLPGLSKVYADRFRDPAAFRSLLEETAKGLQSRSPTPAPPRLRSVTVTSFSAGFGGVRELLRHEDIFQRIDTLVMLDSIYAGFADNSGGRRVSAENMAGFLRFAREAADGRKRFLLTHSQLHTPGYASTAETADYLIAQLGGAREAAAADWPGAWKPVSRFRRGGFEVLGFAGDTGEDHMRHLRRMGVLLERAFRR